MNNAVTLKELMTRALGYADFPKDSLDADQKAELIANINLGLLELWEAMIDAHPDMVHKVASTITLVAGTEAYNLPADFYKAIKVFWAQSSRRYKMERFNLEEIDGLPKPITAGSVELWYAPPFTRLKNEKATIPAIITPGWEDYGALFAAVRLLDSEGGDSSKWTRERDALMARIRQLPTERDEQVDSIGDYYGRYEAGSPLRDYQTAILRYRIMGTQVYFVEIELGGV